MQQSKKIIFDRFQFLLKVILGISAAGFIIYSMAGKIETGSWWEELRASARQPGNLFLLILVLILMPVNWFLEAVKWRFMIRKMERIPLALSFEAVLSGLTVSFFTPNRIAEFAGRVFLLRSADRVRATIVTIWETYSQLIVTLIAGFLSGIIYCIRYEPASSKFLILVIAGGGICSVLLLVFYFNIAVLGKIASRLRLPLKWINYFGVTGGYRKRELAYVLFLALLRYLVFTLQFYLLLILFGLQLPYLEVQPVLGLTYLAMAIIPTIAWTELGVRGAVAIYFFKTITPDFFSVISASFALWFINLALPALIGSVFILRFRFKKEN